MGRASVIEFLLSLGPFRVEFRITDPETDDGPPERDQMIPAQVERSEPVDSDGPLRYTDHIGFTA